METQKSPYRQSDLAKKNGAGGINLPDFRLHSKATLIRQYETGRKTEIQTNGTRLKARKTPTTYGYLIFDKGGETM